MIFVVVSKVTQILHVYCARYQVIKFKLLHHGNRLLPRHIGTDMVHACVQRALNVLSVRSICISERTEKLTRNPCWQTYCAVSIIPDV